MLRTNLSTRPFYNERAVNAWLAIVALLVAIATVFNVNRVLHYSSNDTQLAVSASRDEAQARELRASAARLRASVDPKQLDQISKEARRANDLIDQRTFSWTELFNRFEATLPDDVRVTAVRPKLDRRGGTQLTIVVVARSRDDVNRFIDNLDATGSFTNVLSREDRLNEEGQVEATLDAGYHGTAEVGARAPAAAHAADASREARR